MKYLLTLLIIILFVTSCKKEKYGNVRQEIKCTSAQLTQKAKSPKNLEELRYAQFGDYITSVTPASFVGELEVVRYYAENESGSFMTLVHRETYQDEEAVLADFSNNSTLSVIPTLNGKNIMANTDGQGSFFTDNVTFKILWIRMGLRQVIELPDEYSQVNLNQFNSNQKVGNTITSDILPFFQAVEELSPFGKAFTIYLGMTNNTYLAVNES